MELVEFDDFDDRWKWVHFIVLITTSLRAAGSPTHVHDASIPDGTKIVRYSAAHATLCLCLIIYKTLPDGKITGLIEYIG